LTVAVPADATVRQQAGDTINDVTTSKATEGPLFRVMAIIPQPPREQKQQQSEQGALWLNMVNERLFSSRINQHEYAIVITAVSVQTPAVGAVATLRFRILASTFRC
jgi:hypothetical protein